MIDLKKILVALLFINWLTTGAAQSLHNPAGSPYTEAVAANPEFTDAFSCAANPAALPNLKGLAAAVGFEKKYLIQDLNLAQLSVAYGKPSGGGAVYIKYFGNTAYRELHVSVNYGKKLGGLSIGASFYYHTYSITGFYRINTFSIGLHSQWKLSDKVFTSLQIMNPPIARPRSMPSQPAEYHLGFSYQTSEAVCLSMELRKVENVPPEVSTALQFRLDKKFFAKAGLFTGGPQPFLGLGWTTGDFHVQVSLCYHPALGSTPGVLLLYHKPADALP